MVRLRAAARPFLHRPDRRALRREAKDTGERMNRAYGTANVAHDVLAQGQPELIARGCDVGALL